MADRPAAAECSGLLRRAGWSVGETAFTDRRRLIWLVSGSNAANLIRARGSTPAEAWRRVCEQARAAGMPGRG